MMSLQSEVHSKCIRHGGKSQVLLMYLSRFMLWTVICLQKKSELILDLI